MRPKTTDLMELAAPDDVAAVLRYVADEYRASQMELQSAWQDKEAGREWSVIAKALDRAADYIEQKI